MISKEKKTQIVKDLLEEIKKAKAVYFLNFSGIKVSDLEELRKQLREEQSAAQVIKKNLAQVVFSQAGYQEAIPIEKEGSLMLGIAFDDCFKTAKTLLGFSKKNENIQILGGAAEGRFLSKKEIQQLAKISSQESLLGRLVGSMSSPMQRLVSDLNNTIQKLVIVLEGIKATK
ncbi:MAG: 50S ribosomal protein L10 [Candidatus Pacebacteria bacterium]|nr:50S ribosomal protein L10 [Candidatus Paceibacterota bacterium]